MSFSAALTVPCQLTRGELKRDFFNCASPSLNNAAGCHVNCEQINLDGSVFADLNSPQHNILKETHNSLLLRVSCGY